MAESVNPETGELEELEWEAIGPTVFKFETMGTMLIARYLGSDVQELDNEPTTRHDVQMLDGKQAFFWGSTVLDNLLKHVAAGQMIRLIYTGESEKTYKGGNKAKLFSLERAR